MILKKLKESSCCGGATRPRATARNALVAKRGCRAGLAVRTSPEHAIAGVTPIVGTAGFVHTAIGLLFPVLPRVPGAAASVTITARTVLTAPVTVIAIVSCWVDAEPAA